MPPPGDLFPGPKSPDPSDPAWRKEAGHGAVKVVELTAILAAVSRLIPGPVGKVAAFILVGMEKSPETGKLRLGKGTAGNFAPSPFGFMKPEVYGLKPNFWLPGGVTKYLPDEARGLGLGIKQQFSEDDYARDQEAARRRARAAGIVKHESLETVLRLAEGTGMPWHESNWIRATSGIGYDELQGAARAELKQRGYGYETFFTLVDQLMADSLKIAEQAGAATGRSPFSFDVPSASIQPEGIVPVNDAAKRNAANADGLRAELVSERADP